MNVRREIEAVTERSVTIGSVYVTLDRLEAKGLVRSTRQPAAGAGSRRVFAVTTEGQRAWRKRRNCTSGCGEASSCRRRATRVGAGR